MKNLFIILMLILLFSCDPQQMQEIESPQIIYIIPGIIEPEPTQEIQEEEEITMIIAYLNYDGKLFSYSDKGKLIEIQEGDNLSKAGDIFIQSKNAGVYDGIILYQGLDGNIYRLSGEDHVLLFENTRNDKAIFPASEDGIMLNYRFIQNNGTIDSQSYIGVNGGIIFKIIEVGNSWDKYIRKNGEWVKVGSSTSTSHIQFGQVNCDGKVIISTGGILENDVLTEPTYNLLKREYVGGNAFVRYIQPLAIKRIFTGIGYIDGIAYFLCARDGKIYKYNVVDDILTEWIGITLGTDNYEKSDSQALFDRTQAILTSGYIIYWSDGAIKRIDIKTGESEEIAQSTGLRAWVK